MLISKIKNCIEEQELIKQKDRIVVALSGGADSVCLLISLLKLKDEMGFSVRAMHINHMIRGGEADADEAFAKNLCEKYGVEFESVHVDVPTLAKEEGLSEEEAGRKVRYEKLRTYAAGDKIAVAHNRNDQVETVLFNILRGTSLKGLSGMKYINGDIIRPLLDITRDEIEEYLKSIGQDYCTDSTNLENDYTRNKLRNKLIPMIEEEFSPAFSERLLSLSRKANDVSDFMDEAVSKIFAEGGVEEIENGFVINAACREMNSALAREVVYKSICEVICTKKNITERHVESVLNLLGGEVGRCVNLPRGVIAKTGYDGEVAIRRADLDSAGNMADKDGKASQDRQLLDRLNESLKSAKVTEYLGQKIPEDTYKKWFDYDKIKQPMSWRFRNSEDVILIDKVGRKKLKDFMIDLKIPQEERDHIPVLCDGNNVVWLLGYRIGADYKITAGTKTFIEVSAGG